ncbi:MAG: FliG C-terminal domain-containing protein [Aquificota bacterium]|nr:FliG C-terminal domain-containing protein [Aquificota bacterium]
MNMLDKDSAENLLRKIGEEDPTLEERIREKMFTFEDIRKLDNRAIIEVLKAVDKNTLIVALKGAPDDIKEKFFSNMSKRAAEDNAGGHGGSSDPVRKSEVERAQKQVVAVIRKLIDEGKDRARWRRGVCLRTSVPYSGRIPRPRSRGRDPLAPEERTTEALEERIRELEREVETLTNRNKALEEDLRRLEEEIRRKEEDLTESLSGEVILGEETSYRSRLYGSSTSQVHRGASDKG